MVIERKMENDTIILELNGEITALTAEQFSVAIKTAIEETARLVLDFKEVGYIASAGLRVLLEVKKLLDAKAGKLIARNVSQSVMHVFEITGFNEIIDLE